MNKIKIARNTKIKIQSTNQDGKTVWLPYKLNDIPKNFGCIEFADERDGIPEWFNHKGLTYVLDA